MTEAKGGRVAREAQVESLEGKEARSELQKREEENWSRNGWAAVPHGPEQLGRKRRGRAVTFGEGGLGHPWVGFW